MISKLSQFIVAFILIAAPASAQDWTKLNGQEISMALTARTLQYPDAKQDFFADGRTLYEVRQPSWGNWRVIANQYCSIWPPSDAWVCYDLERHKFGLQLRFVSRNGGTTIGKYVDLD